MNCNEAWVRGFDQGKEIAEGTDYEYPEEVLDEYGDFDYDKAEAQWDDGNDSIYETFMDHFADADSNYRSYSPWEFFAKELNDAPNSDELWDCFEEGVAFGAHVGFNNRLRADLPIGKDLDDLYGEGTEQAHKDRLEEYARKNSVAPTEEDKRHQEVEAALDTVNRYRSSLGQKPYRHVGDFIREAPYDATEQDLVELAEQLRRDYRVKNDRKPKLRKPKKGLSSAQAMAKKHPGKFEVPDPKVLKALGPGDFVKIAAKVGGKDNPAGERFWLIVESVKGSDIIGVVDNNLLWTDVHGVAHGDRVKFKRSNVYDPMLQSKGRVENARSLKRKLVKP